MEQSWRRHVSLNYQTPLNKNLILTPPRWGYEIEISIVLLQLRVQKSGAFKAGMNSAWM
jgi:hypothetical protein